MNDNSETPESKTGSEDPDFRGELERVINSFSRENGSDTLDFILAEYLTDCLDAYDKALQRREAWYDRSWHEPVVLGGPTEPVTDMDEPRRLELKKGHEHLTVTNEFQSDKYPWCPTGFVPLKITDRMARDSLWDYARRRRVVDKEFSNDLEIALAYEERDHDDQPQNDAIPES